VSYSPARLVSQTDLFVQFDGTDNLIYVFQRNQSSPQTRVSQVTSSDNFSVSILKLLYFLELTMRLQWPFKRPMSATTSASHILSSRHCLYGGDFNDDGEGRTERAWGLVERLKVDEDEDDFAGR
jgi:hypothetical protein